MGFGNNTPTEEEVIKNSKPNTLYWHEFDGGRFFQVVHQDETGFEIKFAPKTMFKVIYHSKNNDIEGFECIKLINGSETQKLKLSKFNFSQLKAFLSFISEIDLKGVNEKRIKLSNDLSLDQDNIKSVRTLLSRDGGAELVESLLNEGVISSKDIVNTSFRKRSLEIFKNLIENPVYYKSYSEANGISGYSEEKVWQYFFFKNQWIFGYGLDYRYNSILQKEAHVSDTNVDGSNTVITDFLLGDKSFTTFVELKKPTTPLFGPKANRSGSWKLSIDLIESVSQILEQKAAGLVYFEKGRYIHGEPLKQSTYNSKVILIIGNWSELDNSTNTLEKEIKKKTFELFRRDSRNIEILTYDELLDRASFIAQGESH